MRALALLLQTAGALVWALLALVAAEVSGWLSATLGILCALILVGVAGLAMRRRWGFLLLVGLGLLLSFAVGTGALLLGLSESGVPVWGVGFYLSISLVPLLATWAAGKNERDPLARRACGTMCSRHEAQQ